MPPEEVEWQFWNIVTTPSKSLEVLYGSDLDTLQYGSGFPKPLPTVSKPADALHQQLPSSSSAAAASLPKSPSGKAGKDKEAKKEAAPALPAAKRYASAGWNLGNLCKLDRCVLAHCKAYSP